MHRISALGGGVGDKSQDADVEWLDSMLPGAAGEGLAEELLRGGYNEHSYLTELCEADELRWIMLPYSRKRTLWDALTLVLVVYTAVVLPYTLAFETEDSRSSFLLGVDVFSGAPLPRAAIGTARAADQHACLTLHRGLHADVLFMIDLLINFRTAYVRNLDSVLVTDRRAIFWNYATGWCALARVCRACEPSRVVRCAPRAVAPSQCARACVRACV